MKDEITTAALLHDVIEDTDYTLADLSRLDAVSKKDLMRAEKYRKAIFILKETISPKDFEPAK